MLESNVLIRRNSTNESLVQIRRTKYILWYGVFFISWCYHFQSKKYNFETLEFLSFKNEQELKNYREKKLNQNQNNELHHTKTCILNAMHSMICVWVSFLWNVIWINIKVKNQLEQCRFKCSKEKKNQKKLQWNWFDWMETHGKKETVDVSVSLASAGLIIGLIQVCPSCAIAWTIA